MPMQIAVDLDDAEHEAFGRWLASTAAAVNPRDPHLDVAEAIRAMIRVTMRDTRHNQHGCQPAAPRVGHSEGPEGATCNHGSGHDRPPLISRKEAGEALGDHAGQRDQRDALVVRHRHRCQEHAVTCLAPDASGLEDLLGPGGPGSATPHWPLRPRLGSGVGPGRASIASAGKPPLAGARRGSRTALARTRYLGAVRRRYRSLVPVHQGRWTVLAAARACLRFD